ncbi:hypothetical protein HPB48_020562 [Haemaphysalis longicornis]|uniref:peptidylglycine monooxygenase n=1 Tax=Haemaphysalis longicornis TaxID=44386 RepID=A0A9J6FWI9_HAELO|nr:hypothetical protein HPB48_020562 [Haemaphysalis longicornis]
MCIVVESAAPKDDPDMNVRAEARAVTFPGGMRDTENETYLCTAFHITPNKHKYVVGFEPNATMHVAHHILIYGCDVPGYQEQDSPRAVWDCGEMSHSNSEFFKGPTCASGAQIVYAWARDAPALKLPEGVGFKIGGNSGIRYLVLQVHYADTTAFLTKERKTDMSGIVLNILPGDTSLQGCDGLLGEEWQVDKHWQAQPARASDVLPRQKGHQDCQGRRAGTFCARFAGLVVYAVSNNGISATGDDEMCNFYMMYYVDGDQILNYKDCFSYGPPVYYWQRDPLLSSSLTAEIDRDASSLDD